MAQAYLIFEADDYHAHPFAVRLSQAAGSTYIILWQRRLLACQSRPCLPETPAPAQPVLALDPLL